MLVGLLFPLCMSPLGGNLLGDLFADLMFGHQWLPDVFVNVLLQCAATCTAVAMLGVKPTIVW